LSRFGGLVTGDARFVSDLVAGAPKASEIAGLFYFRRANSPAALQTRFSHAHGPL